MAELVRQERARLVGRRAPEHRVVEHEALGRPDAVDERVLLGRPRRRVRDRDRAGTGPHLMLDASQQRLQRGVAQRMRRCEERVDDDRLDHHEHRDGDPGRDAHREPGLCGHASRSRGRRCTATADPRRPGRQAERRVARPLRGGAQVEPGVHRADVVDVADRQRGRPRRPRPQPRPRCRRRSRAGGCGARTSAPTGPRPGRRRGRGRARRRRAGTAARGSRPPASIWAWREGGPRGEVRHAGRQVGLPEPCRQAAEPGEEHQPRDAPDHAQSCTAARLTGATL